MPKKKDRYLVIENSSTVEGESRFDGVYGPFGSIKTAKNFIIADARQSFIVDEEDPIGSPIENWGSQYYIVKLETIVRPTPTVNLSISLREV